jgi:AraC-like DNA-binding protein
MAVMLQGSFDTEIARRRFACLPGHSWTEPCEERHANYIGTVGATVVVFQPDPVTSPLSPIVMPLIEDVVHVHDPFVAVDARRVLAEMDQPDPLAALAIDSLMVGMLVRVSRAYRELARRGAPSWLSRVREVLHEEFRSPPSLTVLATIAGVTPTHLCHAFKANVGVSIGEYVRRVRITWAADQLRTNQPLPAIAIGAGYSDQSHFIRECRRLLGARPSDFRRQSRHCARAPSAARD